MKFIHVSDLHLCSSFVSSTLKSETAAEHREQLWKTFRNVIDACRDENIDVLLVSGDIFESVYARTSDIKRIADAFSAIPETKVFISPGNHDTISETSYYNIIKFPPNTHIFREYEGVELPEWNAVIYGFGWTRNRYDSVPFTFTELDRSRTNILCLHCDAVNASDYMPLKTETIEQTGFDYAALGHIHKTMKLSERIYYAGSPEPLNFGEEGVHGYIQGTIDEDKELKVFFTSCGTREFLTVQLKLHAEMDSEQIKALVKESCGEGIDKNIYRILFTGIIHPYINIDDIMQELKDDFYSVDCYDRTVPDYDIKKIYSENKDNIIGKFIYSLTEEATKDPVAYKALLAGLDALLYRQEGGK